MSNLIFSVIAILIGYLFGSISSAVLVSRAFNLPDPREQGSKNPGATNILRLSGKKYAAMVVIFDILKGTIPVLLAKLFPISELMVAYTCLAAVFGHMFPVFFSFKGGKGVATAIGALLGLQFILGIMVVAIWIIVVQVSRYASLASILSMTAMPLLGLWTTEQLTLFTPLFFITLLIFYKHRENITRLIDGNESKLSLTSSTASQANQDNEDTATSKADKRDKEQQKTDAS